MPDTEPTPEPAPAAPGPTPPDPTPPDPAREALARARAEARSQPSTPTTRRPTSAAGSGQRGGTGRDPVLLGQAVEAVLRDQGWQQEAAIGVLTGTWEQVVGPDVAAHVSVESVDLSTATLRLRADSTAWATQVRLLLPTLMARIEEAVGRGVIASVTVQGPAAPSWTKGPRTAPGRGPRDTYG